MLIKLTVLCLCLHVFECVRPAYLRCKRIDTNITILNTLNGRIKGACYNISIKYSNNTVSINSPLLVWLSVPYARSPTGSLRFKSPQAAKSWSNVLNGLDFPYKCMQAPGFDQKYNREDCLYLNIYAPYSVRYAIQNDTSFLPLPVYVWLHGGGFVVGAGSEYDPSRIALISNMIVITVNYRLGAFGFLYVQDTEVKGI